jgi:hypothetical protein
MNNNFKTFRGGSTAGRADTTDCRRRDAKSCVSTCTDARHPSEPRFSQDLPDDRDADTSIVPSRPVNPENLTEIAVQTITPHAPAYRRKILRLYNTKTAQKQTISNN